MGELANVIGVDLGTSAVKVLQRFSDGSARKVREPYTEPLPDGWWNAVCRALASLDLSRTEAIGLDAQVGTYVLDSQTVIGWDSPAGKEEIGEVLAFCDSARWEKEISMRHPHIISYPLPRFLYIQKYYPATREICQPKDWILRRLTGEYRTDPYSWRGLCSLPDGVYSDYLLKKVGADASMLPPVSRPTEVVGVTRRIEIPEGEIREGIPVCTGLNDFFASLLGMGMAPGELFDITGTSEHLGVIDPVYVPEESMASGPWLRGFARYGVTASSGASLDFCGRLDQDVFRCPDQGAAAALLDEMSQRKPPVFLPYLNGERAPIWNPDAIGVFFGLTSGCDGRELAYAAAEGVCFSLLHVYDSLRRPAGGEIRVSGGASVNPLLGLMKAELLSMPVVTLREKDTTALGAAILAMVSAGWYQDPLTAAREECFVQERTEPVGRWKDRLLERYEVYTRLYPSLKNEMEIWKSI